MSQEILSNPDFEDAAAARDQHIFEITGIQPDPRKSIPKEETQEWIRGIQAGNPEAAERLIASRLRWVYDRYAQREAILDRYDLDTADVLQIGSLATLETAMRIDTKDPEAHRSLYSRIPFYMGGLILRSKLLIGAGERGPKQTQARYSYHDARIAENVVPVGNAGDVAAISAEDRTVPDGVPTEEKAMDEEGRALMRDSVMKLSEDERFIIEVRYGIGDYAELGPMSNQEVGKILGISRETIRRVRADALAKLASARQDFSDTPRPQQQLTPAQLELQQKWLESRNGNHDEGSLTSSAA